MPETRPGSRAPWVTAAAAGLVFVVLLVVYLVFLRPDSQDSSPGQLSKTEQQAMDAAAAETVNILSYRRAHFAADFTRALRGATGALKDDIQSEKTKTLHALTTGKYDLSAKVTHEALVGPTTKDDGYVVLVTVNGYQSTALNNPIPSNLQVTVVRSGDKFLASGVLKIGTT